ncbi:P-loop containing nucleoside triphosphate hydrolase protein [Mycena olivaceomarginata]|nr:P-loop containing nucleoside triphosphate hydrolase protein [Mycena olivaceomarginata]
MLGTPLPGFLAKTQLRSGYEAAPKALSYRPYSLNSPGIRKQAPAVLSNPGQLNKVQALDPEEWNRLATHHKLIPAGAELHSFQISVSNRVLMQLGDAVVITPTGSGKSLTWVLPLLARGEGVSLVITPFTSLGLEGELLYQNGDLNAIYIYSEKNSTMDFELVREGSMLIVYICPEMLESPRFAPLVHSKDWAQHISAIYIDEAHLVQEAVSWRPSYSRLHMLRNVLGHNIPLICLSATCTSLAQKGLITSAGLHHDYRLYNQGNFRPELSIIILPMKHDANSFQDLAFVLPLGAHAHELTKTIIYCDDLELLTKMFWWLNQRAVSMKLPINVVDIIHAGLSMRHQELALASFRSGSTLILLGSSKISAGMNFPGVLQVIQFRVRGLTIPGISQRFGRSARVQGELGRGRK